MRSCTRRSSTLTSASSTRWQRDVAATCTWRAAAWKSTVLRSRRATPRKWRTRRRSSLRRAVAPKCWCSISTEDGGKEMESTKDGAALVGRIVLAAMFVASGFSKLAGFGGTVGYIASKGLPMPEVLAMITILIELGAGLAIVFGWKTRWAALAFVVFP